MSYRVPFISLCLALTTLANGEKPSTVTYSEHHAVTNEQDVKVPMSVAQLKVFKVKHGVSALAFIPHERLLVVGAEYRHIVTVWNTDTGDLRAELTSRASEISFTADGRFFETWSADKNINLWDVRTLTSKTLTVNSDFVYDSNLSPDGQTVAVASGGVTLWDVTTGQLRMALDLRKQNVGTAWNVAFSPDGKLLATANFRTLCLWNSSTGEFLRRMEGHVSSIYEIAFSPNGRFLATASRDGTAKLWDTESGQLLHSFSVERVKVFLGGERLDGAMRKVVFSPDGRILATSGGYWHHETKLWDVNSGQLKATLSHKGRTWSIAFSPNGSLLATASENEEGVKLWDPVTGELKTTLEGSHGPMVFSSDAKTLATAGKHDIVILWDVSTRVQ